MSETEIEGTSAGSAHEAARRLGASLGPVIALSGLPDGLTCRSVQPVERDGESWRIVRDRSRRLRLNEAALCASGPTAESLAPVVLPDAALLYRRFILGASRRSWSALTQRLGESAWELALDLARAGVVTVVCSADEGLRLGPPLRWHLTEAGADLARAYENELAEQQRSGRGELERLTDELETVLDSRRSGNVEDADRSEHFEQPLSEAALASLLAALRSSVPGSTLDVLLAASRDVLAGVQHDSPRAFSLAHYADSKERDDVAARLERAGVDSDVARALGVVRAPRLGVAGHASVCTHRHDETLAVTNAGWDVSGLAGPTLVRADSAELHLHLGGVDVVVLENLQAAEAVDEHRRRSNTALAIAYCAGVPGERTRLLLADLAEQAAIRGGRVLICPDADLGGVRIAEAILGAMTPAALEACAMSDIGAWPHTPQVAWPQDSESLRGLRAAQAGLAAPLARACLQRGYRVEQEQSIVTAVRAWLGGDTRGALAPEINQPQQINVSTP